MEEISDCNESVKILRHATMQNLSALLKPVKILPTDKGLPRYWKGLAELCSIEPHVISNLEDSSDPVRDLLKLWQKNPESTVRQLVIYLEKLDRYDVVDDVVPLLAADIIHRRERSTDVERRLLTKDDAENTEPIRYDAFLLYDDDDIDFATRVLDTMEKDYKLKFCAKDRDLMGGTFEHEAVIKLIVERCERLIVILTPSFFSSPVNKFFLNCTQAISLVVPEQKKRKIIPCLYKPCPNMPPEMMCYYMLDYTKPKMWNFWDKLHDSIRPSKKSLPQRSASNRIVDRETRQCAIRPNLRPSQSVKFSSLVDLTADEAALRPSSSANSLSAEKKKKNGWLKKWLPKAEPEKRRFWSRKRKVEVAA